MLGGKLRRRMRPLLPRLPVAPLKDACRRHDTTLNELALRAGIASTRAYRADGLSWGDADKLAVALGYHPSGIWGDDWWSVDADYERVRAASEVRASRRSEWVELERSWRAWRLCRDRIELHREEWPVAG